MHVEHVDARVVGERGEADRGAGEGCDESEVAGKFLAEFLLVVGGRRPRPLLRRAVIVGGQLLDAGAENLRQVRHVRRQQRPHRELFLRAGCHGQSLTSNACARTVITPSRFDNTSLFQKRKTRNLFAANQRSRY